MRFEDGKIIYSIVYTHLHLRTGKCILWKKSLKSADFWILNVGQLTELFDTTNAIKTGIEKQLIDKVMLK